MTHCVMNLDVKDIKYLYRVGENGLGDIMTYVNESAYLHPILEVVHKFQQSFINVSAGFQQWRCQWPGYPPKAASRGRPGMSSYTVISLKKM